MVIRCLIVDDEPPAVEELAYLLEQIKGVDVVGKTTCAAKALDAIEELQPDLVFLDIEMPGRDGFYVVRERMNADRAPLFVFATAYDQYAVKAFEADVIDYILKPFDAKRVRKSVKRARQKLKATQQAPLSTQVAQLVRRLDRVPAKKLIKITVENKGRIRVLNPEEIVFCKSENKGIKVYTRKESFYLYGQSSLDDLENRLISLAFFRTHRSYLVNFSCIKEVIPWFNGRYLVITTDDRATEVPVSRQRVKALKQLLGL